MSRETQRIVDFQLHPLIERIDDLAPYLDRAWVERFTTSEFRMPASSAHPGTNIEARRVGHSAYDPASMARELDSATALALLTPAQPLTTAGWLNHSMATRFCAAVNDNIIEQWLPADTRYRFAISVAPHDPIAAAAEIRRHGANPNAAAVSLALLDVNMGQEPYHPLYEAACEFGLPVVVNPSGFEGGTRGPSTLGGVGPRTPEEVYSILPQVAAANVGSLIFEGVFTQFPDLHVVFAGFGFDWAVSALWRLDLEWRSLRVEIPWVTRPPSEYAAHHLNLVVDASSGVPSQNTWALAEMLPRDVPLWGSDRPFDLAGGLAEVFQHAPAELRERILTTNPMRVLSTSLSPAS